MDAHALSRKLAAAVRRDAALRRDVYQSYDTSTSSRTRDVLERVVAEAADDEGLLLLIRVHAQQGKRFSEALETAVWQVAVRESPSKIWEGAFERFSNDVANLRRRLFAITLNGTAEAKLLRIA